MHVGSQRGPLGCTVLGGAERLWYVALFAPRVTVTLTSAGVKLAKNIVPPQLVPAGQSFAIVVPCELTRDRPWSWRRALEVHDQAVLAADPRTRLGSRHGAGGRELTNILRDVGEDLDRGGVYLPLSVMNQHGVTIEALSRLHRGGPIPSGYRNLLEELMADAAYYYRRAREGLPALPADFRRGVSVAAAVYEGILDEIRRNGYDNGRG